MYVNITEHFRKMIFPRTRFSNTFSPHALVCSVYVTYNSPRHPFAESVAISVGRFKCFFVKTSNTFPFRCLLSMRVQDRFCGEKIPELGNICQNLTKKAAFIKFHGKKCLLGKCSRQTRLQQLGN